MKLSPALFILFTGCSSGSAPAVASGADAAPSTSAPVDASASDAAAPDGEATDDAGGALDAAGDDDGSDGGAPCNTIANAAPVVDVTQVAADPPAPQGGTIVDGVYWGTSLEIYTGPQGPAGTTGTWQATALIQGTTVQLVNSGPPTRRTLTLTTADAGFASADTCPDSQSAQGGYTATPTTLTIFLPGGTDDAGARTVVETLTRQ